MEAESLDPDNGHRRVPAVAGHPQDRRFQYRPLVDRQPLQRIDELDGRRASRGFPNFAGPLLRPHIAPQRGG